MTRTNLDDSSTSQLPSDHWRQLAKLLSAEGNIERVYPRSPNATHEISVLEALRREAFASSDDEESLGRTLHEDLCGLLQQLEAFSNVSRCPILGITGLLNAGKSTLLATFLTSNNRQRVLRGMSNDSGTHRFVLWLPKVWWDDSELLNFLIGYLSSIFGHPPERLSENADEAAIQYNGKVLSEAIMKGSEDSRGEATQNGDHRADDAGIRSVNPIAVPLIAYDECLNDLKIGLVDCPDIQTGFLTSSPGSDAGDSLASGRREQLGRIGRLCSAFVAVAKLNSLHDEGLLQILSTLRDAMRGVPRLLVVNKVKSRYGPEIVREQTRGLVDRFNIQSVYMAYDFRSSLASERIPPTPGKMQLAQDEQLPIFFDCDHVRTGGRDPTTRKSVDYRYLLHLSDELDSGTLTQESNRALRIQLKAKASEVLQWLERNAAKQVTAIQDAWAATSHACYEFMVERDSLGQATGLRLQASPVIVAQMADSLQRTAPAWMRLSLKIDKTARQLHTAVANSAARFKILESASSSVTNFTKKFRRGQGGEVVTPERFAKSLRSLDLHDSLRRHDESQLLSSCELAMKRFAAEDKTELNEAELDEWSRQVWENMSWKDKMWKGTQPLAVMMAPLLAAVLVPIDGGGTAVLVFASTKELLAAAGIAAVMTPMATGGNATGIVQRETPWRQLSDLFAVLCDSLGVPRPSKKELPQERCEGKLRPLLPSSLEVKSAAGAAVLEHWQATPNLQSEYRVHLNQVAE
ncbi:MAG: hypothetical protein ACE361_19820 [Aureliella sp.]